MLMNSVNRKTDCDAIGQLFDDWQNIVIPLSYEGEYLNCLKKLGLPLYNKDIFPFFNFYQEAYEYKGFLCLGDDYRAKMIIDSNGIYILDTDDTKYIISSNYEKFILMIKECVKVVEDTSIKSEDINQKIVDVVSEIDHNLSNSLNWWSMTIPYQYWGEDPEDLE